MNIKYTHQITMCFFSSSEIQFCSRIFRDSRIEWHTRNAGDSWRPGAPIQSFCVLMEQIVGSFCEVKINNDIFVSPVDMFSKVMFQPIRTRCFNFLQNLKVFFFYQRKSHICYCYRITEFISRM